ncbi:MAG: anaerobic ribonucleoside-triphosphate reductase activating protein [Fibrobacterales bacterium]
MTPMTTIDFPGKLSAVLYTKGCPWKCHYCYNTELLDYHSDNTLDSKRLEIFLNERKNLLDAIVICGGEPTSHTKLPEFIDTIRSYGYLIGLHTNGVFPKVLSQVIDQCDWIAMDIKAPLDQYDSITGVPNSAKNIEESIDIIIKSGVAHEFRTTVHSHLLDTKALLHKGRFLSDKGAQVYALQNFQNMPALNPELNEKPHRAISQAVIDEIRPLFRELIIR